MARFIHGRFAPLADKIARVESWPGISHKDIAAALAQAEADGTLAGYREETEGNPLLEIVVSVYCEDMPATLLYARDRMKEAHGDSYRQLDFMFDRVDQEHVRMADGALPFTPNRVVIEVVDLGASSHCRTKARHSTPAGFAVLYAASQSPAWVRQMSGLNVPEAIAPGILLAAPGPGPDASVYMPLIRYESAKAKLGCIVATTTNRSYAFTMVRRYRPYRTRVNGNPYR